MAYFQAKSAPVSSGTAFKVAVRLRPLLQKERRENSTQCVTVEDEHRAIVITKPEQKKRGISSQIEINDFSGLVKTDLQNSQNFFFDIVFGPSSTQDDIYTVCAQHIILSVLEGYNGSIIAYGQTGTGKSYTIEGGNGNDNRGLIPRSSEEIFSYIKNTASIKDRFLVRVSFVEIYNEKISDLLEHDRTNLRVREDGSGGMYVENLSEHIVKSTEDIKALIKRGTHVRTTAATKSNIESSRSHAIFTIIVEHAQTSDDGGSIVTIGKLRLADLAGSERLDVDSQAKRQEETKHINVSLHTFGKVVMALTSSSSSSHIPYRESKLTKILQDSLGGNCKTTMITTLSPLSSSYNESLNSLKFAKRAKHVKNNAIINKDVSQKALLSAYQQEIKKLREQLQSQGGGDEQLTKLEKEKEKAEQLKDQVLSELEQQKLLYSKAEKEKLEYRRQIEKLEEKLLHGGSDVTKSSEFEKVLEVERRKIELDTKREYEQKLAQLEEEKKRLEKDKQEIQKEREKMTRIQSRSEVISNPQALLFNKKPVISRPAISTNRQFNTANRLPHQTLPLRSNLSTVSGPLPTRRPIRLSTSPKPATDSQDAYQKAFYEYYQQLADPICGIPCQELQPGLRIFTGSEAVKWFINNMEGVSTVDEAVRIGNRLIELNMIAEIQGIGDQFLASDTCYYQFQDFSYSNPLFLANSSSRPLSAFSMISLQEQQQLRNVHQLRMRTGSLPVVSNELDSSYSLSASPSLVTLQLTSPMDLMNSFGLALNSPTQLHIACISGEITQVCELARSINIDCADRQGYTPLMYATIGNQLKCSNVLLKKLNASVNLRNYNQQSALMLAVLNGHAEIVRLLIKYKAETKHVDSNGDSVFHLAAKNTSARCLQVLIKYSSHLSPMNERNDAHYTPLHIAAMCHQHESIELLLKAKCDLGISDNEGQTPFHYAVSLQCKDCVLSILSICPNDINLVDIHGMTPLHIASSNGAMEIVNILLESTKCDINTSDCKGQTPLHLAVLGNHPLIVRTLLINGADSSVIDYANKTAENYAREQNYIDCLNSFETTIS